MNFKDQAAADLDVFLNTDELGSGVTVTLAGDGGEFTCRMTIGDAEASPVTDGPSLRQEARIPALASVAEVRPKMIALGLTRTLGQGDRVLVDDGREFGVATCRLDGLGGLLLQLTDATMLGAGMGRQL
jgi:hypothetical protein